MKDNLKGYLQAISFYDYVIASVLGISFALATWWIRARTVTNGEINTDQVRLLTQILITLLVVELASFLLMRRPFFYKINPIVQRASGAFVGFCMSIQVYIIFLLLLAG